MYNRYMNSGGFENFFKPAGDTQSSPEQPDTGQPEAQEHASGKNQGILGLFKNLLGGELKLPELNADTLLLIVLVYFLVADEDENVTDTLLIIGVLLLLGF